MHAELRLAKYFQALTVGDILSVPGLDAYAKAWNRMQVPYGWGQPQNPISHKGSMVFSEHGRNAQLNPFVFMIMFNIQDGNQPKKERIVSEGTKSFFKAGPYVKLKENFTGFFKIDGSVVDYDPVEAILAVSYALSEVIYLCHKGSLTEKELCRLMELVIEERNLLQSFFRCTSKTDYDSVPNIHLPLHYKKDLDFYATLKNVAVMIGEQKHKIFKMHAPHTNSKNRELQLLNMASVNQTIRFLLDGAFPDEDISRQLNYIVSGCPVLKSKFLGAAEYAELEASNLDEEGSIYVASRTGSE